MKKFVMSLAIALLVINSQASPTFTMGYPPPGGVTLGQFGNGAGSANGQTFTYAGFNSSDYSQLYWGLNTVANVAESAVSSTNMVFSGYNASTGIATWVSTADWTFTDPANGGSIVDTATQLLVQIQPLSNTNPGFLGSGFIAPTTTKGALGISGNPSEPLYQVTGPYQVTFEFQTSGGVDIFDFNAANNGGPGVYTSVDFEFWWSSNIVHTNAKTVQVGGCKTNLVNFPNISTALASVSANSTIEVCPGTYPEQLTITQPVKLEGIISGDADAAVITVPGGGLAQNGTSAAEGPIAAQVDIQNAGGSVTITNIIVDGTNGTCNTSGDPSYGIAFEGSGGTITDSAVRNVTNSTCNSLPGGAIDVEGASVKLTLNSIHNFSDVGINVNAGAITAGSNLINSGGTGIQVASGTGLSISNNTISGMNNAGVAMDATTTSKILSNKITGGSYGVQLTANAGPSTGNSVQSNNITGTTTAAVSINDNGSSGGNGVTGNTILDGNCGISQGNAIGDTLTPNAISAVVSTTCP
ncbi:MAG: right-handed parallel beta-helix repeat-containing protein [Candidatus Acidiferrales bacterium]